MLLNIFNTIHDMICKKEQTKLGLVAHIFIPSIWGAEVVRYL